MCVPRPRKPVAAGLLASYLLSATLTSMFWFAITWILIAVLLRPLTEDERDSISPEAPRPHRARSVALLTGVSALSAISPLIALPLITRAAGPTGFAEIAIGQALGTLAATIITFGWAVRGPVEAARSSHPSRVFRASIIVRGANSVSSSPSSPSSPRSRATPTIMRLRSSRPSRSPCRGSPSAGTRSASVAPCSHSSLTPSPVSC